MPIYTWEKKTGNQKKENKKDKGERKWENTKEDDTKEVLEVEKSIWQEKIRMDASAKSLEPCYRVKRGICAEKGKSIFTVKRRKKESTSICKRPVKKRIHLILQIIPDITSTFCSKERWKTKNATRLSAHKLVDNKK